MEVLAVAGAASAFTTIAVEFLHVYKKLNQCCRALKHAREDIKSIRDEVYTFSTLMSWFHQAVTDARLGDCGLCAEIKASKIGNVVLQSGRRALDKIKEILKEVEPLRTDRKYSAVAKWIARWKWLAHKEEWIPVQISLNSIKTSATLLISMIRFQDLVQGLAGLRKGDVTEDLHQQLLVWDQGPLTPFVSMLIIHVDQIFAGQSSQDADFPVQEDR